MPTAPAATPIAHYENFPVASWLCPPHLRAPIAAIYHFARTADDIADEGDASPAQRLASLQAYRQALQQAAEGGTAFADWPQVFGPLQWAIQQYALPTQLLHDLLDAFVQDIEKTRDRTGYADDAELLDYCRRSANPVGRLLLHLYGVHDPEALAQSDAICTALQLINFWQDLSVDIPRGRYYLSDAARAQFGVPQADVLAQRQTESATKLIAASAQSARATMLRGAPLVHRLPGRAGWELRLVVQGGLRILDKIAALDHRTLNQRPVLRAWDFPLLLWRAWRMRA
ncbi:squalene synthase HpnC [Rhodoferax saidenbachensis]|uniref:Squalene synthase HpnC n=1 Tax=Rhodoferax saidenbachensis TaxID=1484693 RepID=A0ABU1ZHE6_9BURK|nr:squalene synthase HpnC [Rhodoferax saidenbachensis]MDR7304952.1 squalene synthase HpnC [Rhodoferax saidenbachensis]